MSAALIYPIILMGVALISVSVILGFVVPRFAEMFADAGQSLPYPHRSLWLSVALWRHTGGLLRS